MVLISDEDAWDSFVLVMSKMYKNSPFNPMSWFRTWGYWVMGEGDEPDQWDWTAKAVWASPAPIAAMMYPKTSFGFIRTTMAITSGMSIPVMAGSASFSPAAVPLLFAGGLLNTFSQLPGLVGYSPQPSVM